MEETGREPYDGKLSRTCSESRVTNPLTLLYILATMFKDSEYATSAGLTYFLLGGLSSCFIVRPLTMFEPVALTTSTESISNKPTNLPVTERKREPQHVSKALKTDSFHPTRGKVMLLQELIILLSQDQELYSKENDTNSEEN